VGESAAQLLFRVGDDIEDQADNFSGQNDVLVDLRDMRMNLRKD
jgi:hypothetical protein